MMLCRTGTFRLPPFHHMSYDTPVETPLSPARVRSSNARLPMASMPEMTAGSRFGFSGSRNGGTKNRSRREPCWCTSQYTCGRQTEYSCSVTIRVSAWVSMNQSRLLSCPA